MKKIVLALILVSSFVSQIANANANDNDNDNDNKLLFGREFKSDERKISIMFLDAIDTRGDARFNECWLGGSSGYCAYRLTNKPDSYRDISVILNDSRYLGAVEIWAPNLRIYALSKDGTRLEDLENGYALIWNKDLEVIITPPARPGR